MILICAIFQHLCSKCGKAYATGERLRTHQVVCRKCPKCHLMVEKGHVEKCKGPRKTKSPRFICPFCLRPRSKQWLSKHFLKKHGLANYKHPEKLKTEVCHQSTVIRIIMTLLTPLFPTFRFIFQHVLETSDV